VEHNVTKKHLRAFFDFGVLTLVRKGLEVVLRTIHCNVCPLPPHQPRPMPWFFTAIEPWSVLWDTASRQSNTRYVKAFQRTCTLFQLRLGCAARVKTRNAVMEDAEDTKTAKMRPVHLYF